MTKTEFLTLWQENSDGRHNKALSEEIVSVFSPDKKDPAKPHIKFYDFEVTDKNKGGRLVQRKQ